MKTKICNSIAVMLIFVMCINLSTEGQTIICPDCISDTEDDVMLDPPFSGVVDLGILPTLQNSENGNWFPATGTVRVLVVFAEIECSACGPSVCDNPNSEIDAKGNWLKGQLPPNVIDPSNGNDIFNTTWFDRNLPAGQQPTPGNLTEFYYQMSLGQHIVIGDYYPELITVPCTTTNKEQDAVTIINNKTLASGSFATKQGFTLADFDNLSEVGAGLPKTNSPNGNIDVIVFVWRNYDYNYEKCDGGLAVWPGQAGINTINQNSNATMSKQTYIGGSWRACSNGTDMFKTEYMHGLFGGNHWHSGGGAGSHTFLSYPGNFSMTSYSMVGALVCGYDRHRLGWYGWQDDNQTTKKSNLISAKTTSTTEAPTDFDINTTFPDGQEIILRDFVTYGDAIRIKLPYINWTANGDIKNQYLWIENHQKKSSFDKSNGEGNGCKESWIKGIYSYIQVGKDIKEGNNIYTTTVSDPNGLGSWLFPISAEGNYDFKYRYDLAGSSWDNCVWQGNKFLPIEKSSVLTLPNPFTGMSDLINIVDYSNDGILRSGDSHQPWTAEVVDGQVKFTLYASGDSEDGYTCSGTCSKKILSLGSNPAPVPVYTYTFLNTNINNVYVPYPTDYPNNLSNYENRTIWLNGISVEILQENVDGNGAIKVKLRFDDYEVNNDVRWCGNIKLSPNYFDATNYSLNLLNGSAITLDRGKSPTQHVAVKDGSGNYLVDADGRKIFTQPTTFTMLPNSYFHLEAPTVHKVPPTPATLTIQNYSQFTLENDSKLIAETESKIEVKQNSTMTVNSGALVWLKNGSEFSIDATSNLVINDGGKVVIEGNFYYNSNLPVTLNGPNAILEISGSLYLGSNVVFQTVGVGAVQKGFVRFKRFIPPAPASWIQPHIIFSNNSHFLLTGNNTDQKIMELDDFTILNIENYITGAIFKLQDGKIEMGENATLSLFRIPHRLISLNFVQKNTGIKFTGIILHGFSNIIVNGISIDGAIRGIEAFSSVWGSSPILKNITFKNCDLALSTQDKGLLLENALFENNAQNWYGINMSVPCTLKNVTIHQTLSGGNGIMYTGSQSAPLYIESSTISDNYNGIYVAGSSLKLKCGVISNNVYGIFIGPNGYLEMGIVPNTYVPAVWVVNNNRTAEFANARGLYLTCGFNNLIPNGDPSSGKNILYGSFAQQLFSGYVHAPLNKWGYSNQNKAIQNGNYYLFYRISMEKFKYSPEIPIPVLSSPSISSIPACDALVAIPPKTCGKRLDCVVCRKIHTPDFPNEKINRAIEFALENLKGDELLANQTRAIDQLNQILMYDLPNPTQDEKRVKDFGYLQMLEALGKMFELEKIRREDIPNRIEFPKSVRQMRDSFIASLFHC